MSKAKHTPGPWTVISSDPQAEFYEDGELSYFNPLTVSVPGGGQDICSFEYDGSPISRNASVEEIKANARLIAAAPELLEALEVISEAIDAYGGDLHNKLEGVQAVRDAIAKVRGGD